MTATTTTLVGMMKKCNNNTQQPHTCLSKFFGCWSSLINEFYHHLCDSHIILVAMKNGRVIFLLSALILWIVVSAFTEVDLLLASEIGDVPQLERIIESGTIDVEMKWREKMPLHVAAENGKWEFVARLLQAGVATDVKDYFGFRAITRAVTNGHLEATKTLVAGGADIYGEDDVDDETYYLLETAASRGHVELVSYFLDLGLDINHKSAEGNTPLIMASLHGHDIVVEQLLNAGANVSIENFQRNTALIAGAYKSHAKVVRALLAHGANPDHVNIDLSFPLILAARENAPKVMRELIKAGANVDALDNSKASALLVVSKSGHMDCMRQLLAKKAHMDFADSTKQTALQYTYVNNHKEASKLLALAGASHGSGEDHDGIAAPHIPKVPACYWFRGLLKRYGLSQKQTKGDAVGRKACEFLADTLNLRGSIVKLLDMISFYGYRATVDRLAFDTFAPEGLDNENLEEIKRAARNDLKSMHTKDYKQHFRDTDEEEMEKNLPDLLRKFGAELPVEPGEDDVTLHDIAYERVTRKEFHRASPDERPDHFKEGSKVPKLAKTEPELNDDDFLKMEL
jgi:ankyrin repeat protein